MLKVYYYKILYEDMRLFLIVLFFVIYVICECLVLFDSNE